MTDLVVDGADRRVAALNAFTAATLAGAVAALSDPRMLGGQDWRWPAAAGAALGCMAAVIPARRGARAAAAVLGACWSAPFGWVAYGWGQHLLWSAPYWEALGAGAAVLGMAASVWSTPTDFGAPMRPAAVPAVAGAARPGPVDEWAELIARVTKGKIVGVTGVTVRRWDTGNGYTAYGTMPPDGSTWETLAPYEPGLAAALRLPPGGGVEVGPDLEADAAAFTIRVLEQDAMAASMTYPGLDDDEDY